MPIRHVYEKVKDKKSLPPHDYRVDLEDGTVIHLPGTAESQYAKIDKGDRVLIDLNYERIPGAAHISISRHGYDIISFGVNIDYITIAGSKESPRILLHNAPNNSVVELPLGSRVCGIGDLAWDLLNEPCPAFVTEYPNGHNYCIVATGRTLRVDETEVELLMTIEDILMQLPRLLERSS